MSSAHSLQPTGYSDVTAGHIATVVTCLEMLTPPEHTSSVLPEGITLDLLEQPDLDAYRRLFKKVGADWLWFSRLLMNDRQLSAILNSEKVDIYIIRDGEEAVGLLELDFSTSGQCELSFLGLTRYATGKGLGRAIMNQAIAFAWAKPIERFWVHTCTFDHPSALQFYIRSGFTPFALQVEVQADPRLSGHLPPDVAPHVPLIRNVR